MKGKIMNPGPEFYYKMVNKFNEVGYERGWLQHALYMLQSVQAGVISINTFEAIENFIAEQKRLDSIPETIAESVARYGD